MLPEFKKLIQVTTYDEPKFVNGSKLLSYGKVDIDETCIDIFKLDTTQIKPWQPKIKLKPYEQLTKIYLDIETCGLNPETDRIYLIGVRNGRGKNRIFGFEDESKTLKSLFKLLEENKPDILFTFNGFDFDLPFIIRRAEMLGIPHQFYVSPKKTRHTTAQKFGEAAVFNSVYFNNRGANPTAVIDLYHQLLSWDFVARKLLTHNLKDSPVALKLRKEPRLDLGYQGILDAWQNDRKKLEEYLVFDLEDTELLGDFLMPGVYYQQEYLPDWKIQAIATAGNGSKWNDILKKHYGYDEVATPKLNYKGALTFGLAGFYRNIAKIDVKSLYPNCQKIYGIHSSKDPHRHQLSVLNFALEEKDRLEELGKSDRVAKERRGTTKVIANSGYGALGSGIPYNDYCAAAAVTAYGRAIFRFMFKFIERYPGTIILSADTDGLYYSCSTDNDGSLRKQIHADLQAALPKGVEIAYELTGKGMFVPSSDKLSAKEKLEAQAVKLEDRLQKLNTGKITPTTTQKISDLADKLEQTKKTITEYDFENDTTFNNGNGIRKNYIIVLDSGKLYLKGKYVKRNVSLLERTFQPELVKLLTLEGEEAAIAYYHELRDLIESGQASTDLLKVTRKAAVTHKTVRELGLVADDGTCIHWECDRENPSQRSKKRITEKTNSEPYSKWFYVKLLDEMFLEVFPQETFKNISEQLAIVLKN
jgi:DNA polymerase, archaea type